MAKISVRCFACKHTFEYDPDELDPLIYKDVDTSRPVCPFCGAVNRIDDLPADQANDND